MTAEPFDSPGIFLIMGTFRESRNADLKDGKQ